MTTEETEIISITKQLIEERDKYKRLARDRDILIDKLKLRIKELQNFKVKCICQKYVGKDSTTPLANDLPKIEFCDFCEQIHTKETLRPYKYETGMMICQQCEDEKEEENNG